MDSPSQSNLDKIVREFVSLATGLDFDAEVIPGNDPHPSPNVSYATVLEIITKGDGTDAELLTKKIADPTTADSKLSGRRFVTYSIQFYKTGASDNARALLSYVKTTPGQIFLNENDLTWRLAGDIRNIDNLVGGGKYEQRRAIDVTFSYLSNREYDLRYIASVNVDLNLSSSTDLTESVEITDS